MTDKKVKTPPPSLTEMREFAMVMTRMIDTFSVRFRNQVFGELNKSTIDKFSDAQTGNFATIFLGITKRVINKLTKQYSNDRIDSMVKEITGRVDRRNQKLLYENIEKTIGTDTKELIANEGLKSTINAFRIETEQWVKKLRDETLESFVANSLRVMATGGTLNDVLTEFGGLVDKRKNNARTIARTQIATFNSLLTKVRAQKLGIEKAIWSTVEDERVRRCHQVRDGKEFELSKGLYSSCDRKTLQPGIDVNCFPGSSKINHSTFCNKFYRRRFTGKLAELISENGVILRSTPNHPILTTDGFKSAYSINVGDNIITAFNQSIDGIKEDIDRFIPTLEQIFDTLLEVGIVPSKSSSINGKFHGDVSDSDIDIIATDSFLTDELNSSIREKFYKLSLSDSDKMIVLSFLTCNSHLDKAMVTSRFSPNSIVSVLNLFKSSFLVHLRPLELFCFALGAWFNPAIDKPLPYNVSGNTEMFSDSIFALTVLVHGFNFIDWHIKNCAFSVYWNNEPLLGKFFTSGRFMDSDYFTSISNSKTVIYKLDKIVDTRLIDFSDHVYNIETVSGDYITGNALVSNCRCVAILVIPDDD